MNASRSAIGPNHRGKRADGVLTRSRLLESAGTLFGAKGFAETTSKEVAELAQADLASINYHFGSREGLYQATLIEAHRRLIRLEELQAIATGGKAPAEQLRAIIDVLTARFAQAKQWGPSVLGREVLSPSSHIAVLFNDEVLPKMEVGLKILSDITGIPVGDPALFRCAVSTMAPCVILFAANGRTPLDLPAMSRQDIADHLHRFALAGLKAAGDHYAREQANGCA